MAITNYLNSNPPTVLEVAWERAVSQIDDMLREHERRTGRSVVVKQMVMLDDGYTLQIHFGFAATAETGQRDHAAATGLPGCGMLDGAPRGSHVRD